LSSVASSPTNSRVFHSPIALFFPEYPFQHFSSGFQSSYFSECFLNQFRFSRFGFGGLPFFLPKVLFSDFRSIIFDFLDTDGFSAASVVCSEAVGVLLLHRRIYRQRLLLSSASGIGSSEDSACSCSMSIYFLLFGCLRSLFRPLQARRCAHVLQR
jgi:hypothetical protein